MRVYGLDYLWLVFMYDTGLGCSEQTKKHVIFEQQENI